MWKAESEQSKRVNFIQGARRKPSKNTSVAFTRGSWARTVLFLMATENRNKKMVKLTCDISIEVEPQQAPAPPSPTPPGCPPESDGDAAAEYDRTDAAAGVAHLGHLHTAGAEQTTTAILADFKNEIDKKMVAQDRESRAYADLFKMHAQQAKDHRDEALRYRVETERLAAQATQGVSTAIAMMSCKNFGGYIDNQFEDQDGFVQVAAHARARTLLSPPSAFSASQHTHSAFSFFRVPTLFLAGRSPCYSQRIAPRLHTRTPARPRTADRRQTTRRAVRRRG